VLTFVKSKIDVAGLDRLIPLKVVWRSTRETVSGSTRPQPLVHRIQVNVMDMHRRDCRRRLRETGRSVAVETATRNTIKLRSDSAF